MELEHFSHDHPLILLNTEHMNGGDDDGVEVSCYGCELPIPGHSSYYGCKRCLFFLHKSCVELPHEITHPSHPQHPLSLLPNPPSYSSVCDVCREICDRFIYHCSQCKFDVDIKCALVVLNIQQRIQHKSHTHPLIPLLKPSMFLCDACGTKHEGTSYLCTTCGYWINQKCADSLPNTIKLSHHHHHPLTLIYSIPTEFYKFSLDCEICGEELYRRNWVYYCSDSECPYLVHVNCATSKAEHSTECKTDMELKDFDRNLVELNSIYSGITTSNTKLSKDCKADIKGKVLDPNLIILPMPHESVNLMTQFIKGMSLQEKYKEATKIWRDSHDHPLIFFDKQIDCELGSTTILPLVNEVMKNDKKCNGCAQIVSTPFFYCVQCNFFLHEWCTELPTKLRHPCHPEHPLLFTTNFHLNQCRCCGLNCNTFIFGCSDCKFFLDCKCASLPRIIKHEAHKHTLALRQTRYGSCGACNRRSILRFVFMCDSCNLKLCVWCALLPGTVRHRYDKHPFTLTYSPPPIDPDKDDKYYCEICEEEVNPELWFYHCVDCDKSLHTRCIRPIDRDSNVKYGATIMVNYHPHLLTSVRSPKEIIKSPCGRCHEPFENDWYMYYECASCKFWIHSCCVIEDEQI